MNSKFQSAPISHLSRLAGISLLTSQYIQPQILCSRFLRERQGCVVKDLMQVGLLLLPGMILFQYFHNLHDISELADYYYWPQLLQYCSCKKIYEFGTSIRKDTEV